MPHPKTELSTSTNQREVDRGLPSDSSRSVAPLKREKNPPRYGAQHRQDALWEGGNEALPPMWTELKVNGDGEPRYLDNALLMITSHRPLPGTQLDSSALLIPGCEWHISPLGRSYFVNHNTRTTSWKKPTPERPAGSLMPECVIKYGSSWYNTNLAWLGTSEDIMSISNGSICQWTRVGRLVGKPLGSDAGDVFTIAVSPDGLMVVGECIDDTVWLWNIKEGKVVGHSWAEHNDKVRCLDWSPNGAEVAGGLEDGTIRRWNPTTGRQIGLPIKGSDKTMRTIKYSPQADKFASGGDDNIIRVWSKDGELLVEIKGHDRWVTSLCWSKDGAYIFSRLISPSENGNRLTGKNSSFFEVIPEPLIPFVCLPMDPTFSAHHMTIQFASGTSKPISKSETHSGMTTKSWLLPRPPMDNTLPVLSLDRMQKSMCGA